MKTYHLVNTDNGETVSLTLTQILAEINRDRSNDWTDYDATDWHEGLVNFTSLRLKGE